MEKPNDPSAKKRPWRIADSSKASERRQKCLYGLSGTLLRIAPPDTESQKPYTH